MREKCTITQQIFVPLWPIFQLKARNCQLPTLTPCKLFKNSDPKSKQSYSTIAACCTYSWKSFKMDAENTPGMWVCCRFLWPFYAILLTLKASFYCMEIWLTWQWKIGSGRTLWAVIGGVLCVVEMPDGPMVCVEWHKESRQRCSWRLGNLARRGTSPPQVPLQRHATSAEYWVSAAP